MGQEKPDASRAEHVQWHTQQRLTGPADQLQPQNGFDAADFPPRAEWGAEDARMQ